MGAKGRKLVVVLCREVGVVVNCGCCEGCEGSKGSIMVEATMGELDYREGSDGSDSLNEVELNMLYLDHRILSFN